MKIIRLKAENIKRIKAVEIKTDGTNFIEITGKNAQGKSSIMDSIAYALGGKSLIPDRPIRDGEHYGMIEIDIAEFTVRRLFNSDGSTIKITNKDGFTRTAPQQFLDSIIGTLSFDPVSFTHMEPKKRVEMFKKLAGINTDALDEEYKKLYQERYESGAKLKHIESYYSTLQNYAQEVELPDLSQVYKDRDIATKHNNDILNLQKEEEQLNTKIRLLVEQVNKLVAEKDIASQRIQDIQIELAVNPPIDISLFDETINNIQPLIIAKQKHQEYAHATKQLEQQKAEHANIQTKIDANLQKHKEVLQAANLPVKGLEIHAEQLYYNNIPFEQLSQAERLKVAMAMAIAEKPELRIVRIMDGALLDHDSMGVLKAMAEQNDFQVWIETVSDEKTEGNALYIQDGEILV